MGPTMDSSFLDMEFEARSAISLLVLGTLVPPPFTGEQDPKSSPAVPGWRARPRHGRWRYVYVYTSTRDISFKAASTRIYHSQCVVLCVLPASDPSMSEKLLKLEMSCGHV